MSDMRTPLNRVRGLGSAREGTGHFWRIRLSAVALVPLTFLVIGWIMSLSGEGYDGVRASLAQPAIALMVALFVVLSLDHMRLGMQVIVEDYVHHEGLKLTCLMLNLFVTVALGAAALFSILKIAFGG